MDHRSYQSILPTHNKLLQKRWDQQRYGTHREKVRSASCIVDTRAPKAHMHVQMKLKKQQLEEERLAVIERDNRMLLEKMSQTMLSGGRVDDKNLYDHKSLNKEKREKELLRVAEENKGILRRLQAVQPLYNRHKWENDFQGHETFLESIAKYPVGHRTWPGTKSNRQHTRSTEGITLPPLPSKNKKPATKVGEIDEEEKRQDKKPATKADQMDRSDKEEHETEKTDSSHGNSEQPSTGDDVDQQKNEQHSELKADEEQRDDQKDVHENDQQKEEQDDQKDVSQNNQKEQQQDDQKDDHGNDQREEQQAQKEEQQDDQKDTHQTDQTSNSKDNQERETHSDHVNDQPGDQQGNQQDSQTSGPQDEQQDAKHDDQQAEPAADVPQKIGIDLSVEVTHRSVEEKKASALIEVLVEHDQAYRQDLREKYKEQYGKDLLDKIQSSFSSPLDSALCAVVRTPSEFSAWCLHEAVNGQGSAERTLIEILGSKSNEDIKAVRTVYKIMYDKELEEDITCNASGHFEKLLLDLQKGDRVEDETVDQALSEKEAKDLYEAGEGSFGTDESTLIRILANRSRNQLVATFQEYEKVAGKSITESLESETSGVLLQGLKTLVLLALDPWKLWADQMHECLEETGGEAGVTRIVVGAQPKDLPSLKGRYLEVYGQPLTDAAKEKLSGDYGKLIVGLLGD